MCERLDKIAELTVELKASAEKTVEASHRLCMALVKSNQNIPIVSKMEAR
jgi:hypothetical protein